MTVSEVKEHRNAYLQAFDRLEKELARVGPPSLHRLRRAAASRFAELGFPGPRDEEWRFTPVSSLTQLPFELGPTSEGLQAGERFREWPHDGQAGATLLAANGLAPFLLKDSQPLPPGVLVCGLAEAL